MQIKSIIIDKETKATRIDVNKVQLELSAFPLDEENNTEPGSELRLYINSQLLQTIKSDEEGKIKETLVINNNGSEQLLVKIEDVVQGIQSKIKCVMIERERKEEDMKQKDNIQENEEEVKSTNKEKKEEIIKFVSERGRNLSDEKCKEYINDFDVVMAAVRQDGLVLKFASNNLKNNYDIAKDAVKKNGLALEFVSNDLKEKEEIYTAAFNQNMLAYNFFIGKGCSDEKILEQIFMTIFKDKAIPKGLHLNSNELSIFSNIGDAGTFLSTQYSFITDNEDVCMHTLKNARNNNEAEIFDHMTERLKSDRYTIKRVIRTILKKHHTSYTNSSIFKIIGSLSDNLPQKQEIILDIIEEIKEAEEENDSLYLYYSLIEENIRTIGTKLINNENFIEKLFDDYFTHSKVQGKNIIYKKQYMIDQLIKEPKCRLAKDKNFVLKLIKTSQKNVKIMNDEAGSIMYSLIYNHSRLLNDRSFILSAYNELNASTIDNLTRAYHIGTGDRAILLEIKNILDKKDPNIAKSFASDFNLE